MNIKKIHNLHFSDPIGSRSLSRFRSKRRFRTVWLILERYISYKDEFITENLPRLTAVDHDDDYVG